MSRSRTRLVLSAALVALLSSPAEAQQSTDGRRLWLAGGGTWTTLLGDCTGCDSANYLHSGGVVGNVGFSLNSRADLGAEVFWVPVTLTTGDHIQVTFLMAAANFRPWRSRGFVLKAAAGIAFMRNWLNALDAQEPPVRSKAFALALGAGWEWKLRGRLGTQIFGAQHATAVGDLQTSERTIENVMGNYWSVGAGLVLR